MKLMKSIVVIAGALSLSLGCASGGGNSMDTNVAAAMPHQSSTPEWISQPRIEGGMVVTSCVTDNGPMNILKSKASALARADLAKELEQKTVALSCSVQSQRVVDGQAENIEDFQERMQGVTRQYLRGTRVERADYATVGGKSQFCTMVVISPAQAERLRSALFDGAGAELSDDQEAAMWEEFLYAEAVDTVGGCPE